MPLSLSLSDETFQAAHEPTRRLPSRAPAKHQVMQGQQCMQEQQCICNAIVTSGWRHASFRFADVHHMIYVCLTLQCTHHGSNGELLFMLPATHTHMSSCICNRGERSGSWHATEVKEVGRGMLAVSVLLCIA